MTWYKDPLFDAEFFWLRDEPREEPDTEDDPKNEDNYQPEHPCVVCGNPGVVTESYEIPLCGVHHLVVDGELVVADW